MCHPLLLISMGWNFESDQVCVVDIQGALRLRVHSHCDSVSSVFINNYFVQPTRDSQTDLSAYHTIHKSIYFFIRNNKT